LIEHAIARPPTGPIVTQIAIWQSLEDSGPLLRGFAESKRHAEEPAMAHRYRRTLRVARLVLAGPIAAEGPSSGRIHSPR
jgi:hypothetical protein